MRKKYCYNLARLLFQVIQLKEFCCNSLLFANDNSRLDSRVDLAKMKPTSREQSKNCFPPWARKSTHFEFFRCHENCLCGI